METSPNKITLNLDSDTEVNVKGFIEPIEYTQYNYHVKWDALANLRVVEPEKQYSTSMFSDFLTQDPIAVGDVWEVKQDAILKLLKQLHPKPNVDMHLNAGDSCGLWACLRAYNDEYVDIMFRIHAEFKLTDGWFTPSQFKGNLVIERSNGRIVSFKMYVPKGVLNFDVNWYTKLGGYSKPAWYTDIGYCPQMELRAGIDEIPNSIEFAKSISQEVAENKLIRCFYKSQQINWVSLEEALKIASVEQKPIHAISIDGPLADESC